MIWEPNNYIYNYKSSKLRLKRRALHASSPNCVLWGKQTVSYAYLPPAFPTFLPPSLVWSLPPFLPPSQSGCLYILTSLSAIMLASLKCPHSSITLSIPHYRTLESNVDVYDCMIDFKQFMVEVEPSRKFEFTVLKFGIHMTLQRVTSVRKHVDRGKINKCLNYEKKVSEIRDCRMTHSNVLCFAPV